MDPARSREMPSCSAVDLAEIQPSSKISSWIWSIISRCGRAKYLSAPRYLFVHMLVYNKHLFNASYFPQFCEIPADDPKLWYFWSFCNSAADSFFLVGCVLNPLKPELNSICYLLALLAHHFLHLSRIRVKSLTFRRLMSYIYIYGAPILDVSRSHTTTQHSR